MMLFALRFGKSVVKNCFCLSTETEEVKMTKNKFFFIFQFGFDGGDEAMVEKVERLMNGS